MISFGSFSHPDIVKLEADRNSAFPRSLLRALLRARARRQMGEGWEAQWQARGCCILALGAPSPCLSLSVFLEEIISPQLRSWQLETVNCYFWSRQDPTSEGRTGCCQVRSTDACFSKELFHPPPDSELPLLTELPSLDYFPPVFYFHCLAVCTISFHFQHQWLSRSSFCVFPASLLKRLKHANIVLLHDIVQTKETLTFVFEYMVSWCFSSFPWS